MSLWTTTEWDGVFDPPPAFHDVGVCPGPALQLGVGIAVDAWNDTLALMLGPSVAFLGLTHMLALCLGDFAAQWAAMSKMAAAPAAGEDD